MSPARPAFRRYKNRRKNRRGATLRACSSMLEAAVATHSGGILRLCRAIFPCLSTSHATVAAPARSPGKPGRRVIECQERAEERGVWKKSGRRAGFRKKAVLK